jgi:hypothetical protein
MFWVLFKELWAFVTARPNLPDIVRFGLYHSHGFVLGDHAWLQNAFDKLATSIINKANNQLLTRQCGILQLYFLWVDDNPLRWLLVFLSINGIIKTFFILSYQIHSYRNFMCVLWEISLTLIIKELILTYQIINQSSWCLSYFLFTILYNCWMEICLLIVLVSRYKLSLYQIQFQT